MSDLVPGVDREWGLLVGGVVTAAQHGGTYPSSSPTTEEEIARVPDATAEDVDAAVVSAAAAQPAWGHTSLRERARALRTIAALLREHSAEFAMLDALDAGLPITTMRNDVDWACELLEVFADLSWSLKGENLPASVEHLHFTAREPFGVVARIIPFNHPIFFAAAKIAAPLLAGNAVVLKPPDVAPLSALRLGELIADVLPPGILSVLVGAGPTVGDALVRHPLVRRIGFIGSGPTGQAIQRAAAESGVKDVTLELGGKNAMIVTADADLDRAAAGAVAGMNFVASAGQSCGSNSRLLVHKSLVTELLDRVIPMVAAIRVGDPTDPATQMGPLTTRAQLEKTQYYVDAGVNAGARLLTGGTRPNLDFATGHFFAPTVFADVDPFSALGQEEVFGPVLSVMTFSEENEAMEIANGTPYGLTASVWSRDLERAHRLARRLDAGYVWINGSSRHFWGTPFGGVNGSGVGREESTEELESYSRIKTTHVIFDSRA